MVAVQIDLIDYDIDCDCLLFILICAGGMAGMIVVITGVLLYDG